MPAVADLRELKRVKTAPVKPKGVPSHQDLVDYKHAVAGQLVASLSIWTPSPNLANFNRA